MNFEYVASDFECSSIRSVFSFIFKHNLSSG